MLHGAPPSRPKPWPVGSLNAFGSGQSLMREHAGGCMKLEGSRSWRCQEGLGCGGVEGLR